jgi:hypothetical protein
VSQQKYKLMFVVSVSTLILSTRIAYYKHNDCASCVSPGRVIFTQDIRFKALAEDWQR